MRSLRPLAMVLYNSDANHLEGPKLHRLKAQSPTKVPSLWTPSPNIQRSPGHLQCLPISYNSRGSHDTPQV